MSTGAYYCTVEELNARGKDHIPDQMVSSKHLIYSSPATLAFNSPGAEGFGVKRAGLAVPGSIMLIVSPGCCGRNTSVLSSMRAYHDRFYYLLMDETDIVTGRHLKKIPKAVAEICAERKEKPSVVMICITCVDALLGTDMERVCRKAQEAAGLPVKPCYMYALTREGRKPPMVHVRQSIYSLLEPRRKKPTAVNLLGYFSPLTDDCELYDLLRSAGVKTIREISRCADYEEYLSMAEANFNLVLHPEARFAAEDFHDRLQIPFIELRRLYQIDKIARQYRAFGAALGVTFADEEPRREAEAAIERFRALHPDAVFAVGEWMNGDPFELSLALIRSGFRVAEIYGTLSGENFVYIKQLAEVSPGTRVYSNLEPTMLFHGFEVGTSSVVTDPDGGAVHAGEKKNDSTAVCVNTKSARDASPEAEAESLRRASLEAKAELLRDASLEAEAESGSGAECMEREFPAVTLTIGKDAGYYHRECPNLQWNGEEQPFGYAGVRRLFDALTEVSA